MSIPIKYNLKDPDIRVNSLEAVCKYLKHYREIICASGFGGAIPLMEDRTIFIHRKDGGEKAEIDLGEPHGFELAWQGLTHALEGARRNQIRLHSQREKKAKTKARVGELEAQLRGLK